MNPALQRSLNALQRDPKKSIDAARRGSVSELITLANFWQEIPNMVSLGVMDVFCTHLDERKAPSFPNVPRVEDANLAFMSLLGLSKLTDYPDDDRSLGDLVLRTWPGIYKWGYYFFQIRIVKQDVPDDVRRQTLDVISGGWCVASREPRVRQAMLGTPGLLDIAVQLWVHEDGGPVPSLSNIPLGSALLDALLSKVDERTLTKVVKAAGGKAPNVAKMALSRLRSAIRASPMDPARTQILADLINEFSYEQDHRLRYALLSEGVIGTVTQALVAVSKEVTGSRDPAFLDAMLSLFGYLKNCLESTEGFTWVSQALNAGLITAFVDCSPTYAMLSQEDREMILSIFSNLLPRYMIYYSVIAAAEAPILKVDSSEDMKKRIRNSVAKDVWSTLRDLVLERRAISVRFSETKKNQGVACDNVKCHKIDFKNNFKKCTGCQVTLYCSKECLVTAWKEGDHKTVCKLKQQERQEGKLEPLSKRDRQFLHYLSMHDARQHLPHLREEAKSKFPSVPLSSLIISIDYTGVPSTFTVQSLENYSSPPTSGSQNAEARHDSLVERVQKNPGSGTLVEARISGGREDAMVATLAAGDVWNLDRGSMTLGDADLQYEEGGEDDLALLIRKGAY